MNCIVTHGWGGWVGCAEGATIWPNRPAIQPCNTARKGHDTADPCVGACGSTRALGQAGEGVAIQKLYCGWGQLLCRNMATIQAAIRRPMPYYTVQERCDTRSSARDTARGRACVAI